MKAFTELFLSLDASNRTTTKVKVLKQYFRDVDAADGAWAVFFLSGNRLKRSVKLKDFREWAGEACGFPAWMVEECYDQVGDLAETLALLVESQRSETIDRSLQAVVEEIILPLRAQEPIEQKELLQKIWQQLDSSSCFIFNKLITGGFRVGVSKTLVQRSLADIAGVDPAIMAHRLMGTWSPSAQSYAALFADECDSGDPAKPYPFCLAYPLEVTETERLTEKIDTVDKWQIEWKWDGIRAQLIKRNGEVILWSRGEEIVSEQFPEVCESVKTWPDGVVLDGELLVWDFDNQRPMNFAALQRRLGRKKVGAKLLKDLPVIFMAYDLLECDGADKRQTPTVQRRMLLESFIDLCPAESVMLSSLVVADDWLGMAAERERSRGLGVEGLMLKLNSSYYNAGRKKGDWWKWKVDPYTVDAVMVYAQQGHGRRAGLHSDYTFSIWLGDQLVPFAKAYSGLTDKEIKRIDTWIRAHTREKHGPVRVVDPELVFEIAFEGISESKRHKSGIAVRFPRILRWREDKSAAEADSLETVLGLLGK